nr:nitroreductase family protein [Oceanococcus sp. HetDA_MAG_MS8]
MSLTVAQAIEARRSVKYFDSDYRLDSAEESALKAAARLSPTAFNIQNGRYVLVRDPQIKADIRKAAWDQPQVSECSLLMVLCYDLMAWDRDPQRYWRNTPEHVATQMVSEIRDFYRDDETLQRDEGMRSCGIAAGAIMLQARALGLDTCAMDGFDFKRVGHLIGLPADHEICLMIAIGKAVQPPHPRPGLVEPEDIFFDDGFA